MSLADLFYRYKDRGVVERHGQKYKKYVKVPLLRTKHKQAALTAALVVLAAGAVFGLVRRFAERSPVRAESAP